MEEEIKRTKELNDKYEHIYNEKYAGRNLHEEPSPETRERLKALEITQQLFMDKLEQSIQDNKEAHNSIVEMINKIEEKLDRAIEKKADKDSQWAEKVLIGFGVVVATGLLGWLGSLIISAFKHIQ